MPANEKVAVVTGGNRGIGYAICEGLWAEGGFHTVIACRNPKDGEASKAQIMAGKGSGSMSVMQLDLCNFESVRGFVAAYFKSGMSLDVLITNAGILKWKGWDASKDGFEEHLQANHLGHFLLVRGLLPIMLKNPRSRVISVGSELALHGTINWDNMNDKVGFDAYMQSKLCNLLHIKELHRLNGSGPHNLRSMCVDPGEANTDIVRHFPMGAYIKVLLSVLPSFVTSQRTMKEGADSVTYCATCDDDTAATFSGRFVRDRTIFAPAKGVSYLSPWAKIFLWSLAKTHVEDDQSDAAAKRMWEMSEKMVDGKLSLPPRVEREEADKDKGMSGTMLAVYLLLFIIVCSYAYDFRIKYLL